MCGPYPPVAPTSYPGMAEIEEQQGPKTYVDRDFSSVEDWVPRWRAVGLLGALVLGEGLVLWVVLARTGIGSLPGAPGPGSVLVGSAFLLSLGGVTTILFGFTEEGVAFFGAAATGMAVDLLFPLTGIPALYPLLADPGPYGTDLAVILGLLVAGALLLVVGVVKSVKAYRAPDEEESVGPAR